MQSALNTVWENTGSAAVPAAAISEAAAPSEVAETATDSAGEQPSA